MRGTLICLVAFGMLVSEASACCMASSGPPVWMKNETVIIVWDSVRKVQHFIRQADFDTKAREFGFIVPTPSVPDFGVADRFAFERLESLIPVPANADAAAGFAPASTKAAGGVEVLKTERVGDYQATVVKATDGAKMNAWLKENGFVSRPAMTEWLDFYSKKSWVFTALKYVAKPGEITNTQALRLSFKTDKPHYPYKMPSDTFNDGDTRPLKLYFVSNSTVKSSYAISNDQWEAETVWSGPLPEDQRAGLAKDISLKTEDIPAGATVTIFENGEKESNFKEDLVFAGVANWTPMIFGSVVLIAIAAWAFNQRNRRRFVPAT
ncbi:MAG: DUF2330 domain-containing protein [Chlorobia bacterium]|nr:DUF2330 domain-containing protein [Fimbriimonadaceae bacterium]